MFVLKMVANGKVYQTVECETFAEAYNSIAKKDGLYRHDNGRDMNIFNKSKLVAVIVAPFDIEDDDDDDIDDDN